MINLEQINGEILRYIEAEIIPQYEAFDPAHNLSHVATVIEQSLEIAADYDVRTDMVYVIAAYHDIGLRFGRAAHEKNSGALIASDERLRDWFTEDDIAVMRAAVEDHRASNTREPRSIYGKIVAEADRIIDYDTILVRTVQFSAANHPEYDIETHFLRCREHIYTKYGVGGYLKLWLDTDVNVRNLEILRAAIADEGRFRADFDRAWKAETGIAAD